MSSLLNTGRPPVFCPGCAHERVAGALDQAFQTLGVAGHQVALVSDIGCFSTPTPFTDCTAGL